MMSSWRLAFYGVVSLLLIVLNTIFMGMAIFYFENMWLFVLSLILTFIFVWLRNIYEDMWYEQVMGAKEC